LQCNVLSPLIFNNIIKMKTNYSKFSQSDILNQIYYQQDTSKKRTNILLYNIVKYLDIKDLYNFKLSCKTISYSLSDKLIKQYFKSRELTGELRRIVWDKYLNIDQ
jgi:hypothetical protein